MIRRLVPLMLLVILALALLWPVIIGGRALFPVAVFGKMSPWDATSPQVKDVQWNALSWDTAAYFYPARMLLGRSIRSGELPLWNPYQMCGTPFLADGQSAVLYPPNLLFAILPPDRAFALLALLHLIAAGLFTYIFLRGLGLGRAASTFGGIAFMLGGFAIAWLELPVFLSTAIWLPLALHFSHRSHEKRSIHYAAGAGVCMALSLLGGHPQIAFYCLLTVGLYWLYLSISGWRRTSVWLSLVLACFAFAFGLALAAPQLFASAELASLSHRGGVLPTPEGYTAYSKLAMPWQKLIVFFAPDFFGNPSRADLLYWGQGQYPEYCGYAGVLTLFLAFLAFGGKCKARRQSWFFGGLTILALAMALGTDVNRLFYFGIPGFSHSGSPARVLFLFAFSAAVLGALGLERILSGGEEKRRLLTFGTGFVVLGMLVFGGFLVHLNLRNLDAQLSEMELINASLPAIQLFPAFLLAGLGLVLLSIWGKLGAKFTGVLAVGILISDLLAFGVSYNPICKRGQVYPDTELTGFLQSNTGMNRIMPLNRGWSLDSVPKSVLPPNSAMAYKLFDVQGYDSLYPVRYKALLDAAAKRDSCPPENGNMLFARNFKSPIYDLLGVRWFVSSDKLGKRDKPLDSCYVHRNKNALPRAFIVRVVEYADDKEILRRIAESEIDLRMAALVPSEAGRTLKPWWVPGSLIEMKLATEDSVKFTKYTCNSAAMKIKAMQTGVLIFTDQYYPGWEATVDEIPVRITQVDYAFRAIVIPPGEHTVVFSYKPNAFEKGLHIAQVALIFLGVLMIHGIMLGLRDYDRSWVPSNQNRPR